MTDRKCGSTECLLDELKETMEAHHRDSKEFIEGLLRMHSSFIQRELDSFKADIRSMRQELDVSLKHSEANLIDRIEDMEQRVTILSREVLQMQTAMKVGWEAMLDGSRSLGEYVDKRIRDNSTLRVVEWCNTGAGKILVSIIASGVIAFAAWLMWLYSTHPTGH